MLLPLNLQKMLSRKLGIDEERANLSFVKSKKSSRGGKGRCFSDRTQLENEKFRADVRTDSDAGILRGRSYAVKDFCFLRMFVSFALAFMSAHGITLTPLISSNLCQLKVARGGVCVSEDYVGVLSPSTT